jgi:hypothetical protein
MNKAAPWALTALLAATLACSIFVGGPAIPTQSPEPTATAPSLPDQVEQAVTAGASTGVISLQITEGQLTSFLADKLAQQSNPLISDPRVVLQSGQMIVYGKAATGAFIANVSMTLQVSIDANGQPQIQVVKTDFGPLPAPQGFNDMIAASIQEAFTGSLGPVATGFRLESIDIGNGVMTVAGRFK